MDIIFSHFLSDAWGFPILKITVYDSDTENVICCDSNNSKKIYTVSKETIKSICDIIDRHSEILEYDSKDIEFPSVLDGFTSYFIFSDKIKKNEFYVFNIWAFKEDYSKAVKAKNILKVFDSIAEILIKNGIDEYYLQLEKNVDKSVIKHGNCFMFME